MIENILNCPCCNRQLKIVIDGSGNLISTTIFDEQIEDNLHQLLQEKGIEFGQKGSD